MFLDRERVGVCTPRVYRSDRVRRRREKERRKKERGRRRRPGYLHFFPGGTDTQKTGSNIRGEVF